jgi:hypothetical protein
MPLLRPALQGTAEISEQHGLWRIIYAAKTFITEHKMPGRSEFKVAAGIKVDRIEFKPIADAVDSALAQIRIAVENPSARTFGKRLRCLPGANIRFYGWAIPVHIFIVHAADSPSCLISEFANLPCY